MLHALAVFFNRFSRWCHDLGTVIILPLMAVLITINVVARYAFNAPLAWGEELNGLLLFLVLFLSMTYTWDQKRHIRMEIVYVHLKGGWRTLAEWTTGITGIVFFGLLALQCFYDIPYMIKTNETGEELTLPLWIFRAMAAAISLIFVFKLIYFTLHAHKEQEEVVTEIEGVVVQRPDAAKEEEAEIDTPRVAVQGRK